MLIHNIYHPVENPDSLILLSWLSVTENMEIGYCNQFFDHPEFRVLLYYLEKGKLFLICYQVLIAMGMSLWWPLKDELLIEI